MLAASSMRPPASGRICSAQGLLADEAALARGTPYPERREPKLAWHDKAAKFLVAVTVAPLLRSIAGDRALHAILRETRRHEDALKQASMEELKRRATTIRPVLRREGLTVRNVGESFALIREAADRTLGLRHYDTQMLAAWGLVQGRLVEMATGEGKSLAATLAAATMGLAGVPVHVITVNDYLARRDAEEMQPLYDFLGLSVGAITQEMQKPERRDVYARNIAYCTNKDIAFDYLRDRLALVSRLSRLHLDLGRLRGEVRDEDALLLRGLYFAIVDEADSIFIDEARTPLILSAPRREQAGAEAAERALALAGDLVLDTDFHIDWAGRRVVLSDAGKDRLERMCAGLNEPWQRQREREELASQALSAIYLFRRDEHYVVSDDKVQIVDESTGRIMPDRSWERGLHQMIEAKEGCTATAQRETLARITYQRLFPRYLRLSGMTGTGAEVRREIHRTYGLEFSRIPRHRAERRNDLPAVLHVTRENKWRDVASHVADVARGGRPVLVGTRSVEASQEVSNLLTSMGIEHRLLNAKQDAEEAQIISEAGEAGRVTVATNMAGRGTHINLAPGVADAGGLHVVLTEYHESRRIDRQLFGRCARQGEPGTCIAIVALDDAVFRTHLPTSGRWLGRVLKRGQGAINALRGVAQSSAESRNARIRAETLATDRRFETLLAFARHGE